MNQATQAETPNGGMRLPRHVGLVYEDAQIVVLNKPAGMLSIPDRTQSEPSLKDLLIQQYGGIFTVHRLDRETSGLILFAKNEESHKYFSRLFEEKHMGKYYVGLVHGSFSDKEGLVEAPIMEHPVVKGKMIVHQKGKPSMTGFEVLEAFGKYSFVRFRIYTGRTHQIRVHAKQLGHPLVCDPLYGDGKPLLLSGIKKKFRLSIKEEEERPLLNRVALHSVRLVFEHMDGKAFDLEAPLPKDLAATLQQLTRNKK